MVDHDSRQNTSFPSNGKSVNGYLAVPTKGKGPGVIVIQEWWGLTDYIAGVADQLAVAGFVALAPDLFGGTTTHDAEEAARLMQELPEDRAARDLGGAVDFLLAHDAVTSSAVGAVGFCMGGGFVLMLATQQGDKVSAAVPFYGVGAVPNDYTSLTAAVQGHYAEKDQLYPPEKVEALTKQIHDQSGSWPEIHMYPAGHAFHNEENLLGTYDPHSGETAWNRALAFLKEHVK